MIQCRRFLYRARDAACERRVSYWPATLALLASIQLSAVPPARGQPAVPPSLQQEYWARFDDKDWDAAIASAEQLVVAARPATADSGLRLSQALSLLGSAQLSKGNLVAAEQAFTESLQLAEQYGARTSMALVDPLRGLGYTLAAGGKHGQAIPYLDRALLISRRAAGLFDPSQQGLLRQLADSLTKVGSAADAERHMLYVLQVGERTHGEDDPRMVPLYCIVGDWYLEVGLVEQARQYYRQAVSLAVRKLGADNLGTVPPLLALAASFPREIALSHLGLVTRSDKLPSNVDGTAISEPLNPRYLSGEGERALLRALKVLDANPNRPVETLTEALVQTGDWYMVKQSPAKAIPYYTRAAQLINEQSGNDTPSTVVPLLSFPVQVYYPIPPLATRNLNRPPHEVTDRFVQVEFTVLEDGLVTNQRVAQHDATDRQIAQTLEAIGAARYRPKFVDDKPVVTTEVSFRQLFRQRKETE